MKKLMTTVSAVAVAFGLYATDTGTSFEGLGAGELDIYASGGDEYGGGEIGTKEASQTYWSTNGTETLTVVAGTSIDQAAQRPGQYASANQSKYLSIKTTLGNPVTRNVSVGGSGTSIGNGFYFDSLVKFTAFEGDQTVDLNGGKLAIWLRENLGANEEPVSTNLMITAGYLDSSLTDKVVVTNYACSVAGVDFNDGGWHRVTVKAIENIYTTSTKVPGFVVFVDGQYAASTDYSSNTKGVDTASLTQNAKTFHVSCNGALFPSADQVGGTKTEIAAVQFDGQGDVDDLVFTATAPSFAKDYEFFTIKLGANVASVTYTDGTTSDTITEDTDVVYTSGLGIKFTNVVYSNGYMNAAATYAAGVNVNTENGPWYEPSAAEQWVQVNAVLAGATIGNTSYETAAAAFAAISAGTAGAGPFTVTLNTAATSGVELDNSSASVILDLAGNNITAGQSDAAAISLVDGTLLVTNSTVTVGQVAGYNGGTALTTAGGSLTIADGIYNGAVDVSGASSKAITGGKFRIAENTTDKAVLDAAAAPALLVAEAGESPVYFVLGQAVAQIEGGAQYTSLADAVDAAQAGDVVTVLADCAVDAPVSFTKNITVSNNYTIAANVNYALCIGATVTFEGSGKIERRSDITGSAFCVGANETTRGAITAGTSGALIFNSGTVCGGSGGNQIKLENGTVEMNGGVLKDGLRGIKADADKGSYTSAIVINGGTITNCSAYAVFASAESATGTATITINGGVIAGVIGKADKTGTETITIPGTSTAKFNADQTALCEAGYKTVLSDGWYVVTAKEYYTAISLNKATTSIVTNETETLVATLTPASAADDSVTWTSDDTSVATVDQNGVVTAVAAGTATITAATENYSATCTVTVTAPEPQPENPEIKPGESVISVEVAAASADAAIGAVTVTPPTGSGAVVADYTALFDISATAVDGKPGYYDVAITGIKDSVVTGVDTSAVALLTSGSGTVAVPAGLYYKITPSTALPISGTAVTGLSTGAGVEVSKPGTTQGFFKVELSATPFAQK